MDREVEGGGTIRHYIHVRPSPHLKRDGDGLETPVGVLTHAATLVPGVELLGGGVVEHEPRRQLLGESLVVKHRIHMETVAHPAPWSSTCHSFVRVFVYSLHVRGAYLRCRRGVYTVAALVVRGGLKQRELQALRCGAQWT